MTSIIMDSYQSEVFRKAEATAPAVLDQVVGKNSNSCRSPDPVYPGAQARKRKQDSSSLELAVCGELRVHSSFSGTEKSFDGTYFSNRKLNMISY